MSVKASRVEDFNRWDKAGLPGEFKWVRDVSGNPRAALLFRCPCGCGDPGLLHIRKSADEHPTWEWDGNDDAPTLAPSIHRSGGCGWHGYLRNGEFVSV